MPVLKEESVVVLPTVKVEPNVAAPVILLVPITSSFETGEEEPTPRLPDIYCVPITSSLLTGALVPIPTLPVLLKIPRGKIVLALNVCIPLQLLALVVSRVRLVDPPRETVPPPVSPLDPVTVTAELANSTLSI